MTNSARRTELLHRYHGVAHHVRTRLVMLGRTSVVEKADLRDAIRTLEGAEGRAKLGDLAAALRIMERLRAHLPPAPEAPPEVSMASAAAVARTLAEASFTEAYGVGEPATATPEFQRASSAFTAGEAATRSGLLDDAAREFERAQRILEDFLALLAPETGRRLQELRTRRMRLVERLRRLPSVEFSATRRDAAMAAIRQFDAALDASDEARAATALEECEAHLGDAVGHALPPPKAPPQSKARTAPTWGMSLVAGLGLASVLAGLGLLDPSLQSARGLFDGHAAIEPSGPGARSELRLEPARPNPLLVAPSGRSPFRLLPLTVPPPELIPLLAEPSRDPLTDRPPSQPVAQHEYLVYLPVDGRRTFRVPTAGSERIRWEVNGEAIGEGSIVEVGARGELNAGTNWLVATRVEGAGSTPMRAWRIEAHGPLRLRVSPRSAEVTAATGDVLTLRAEANVVPKGRARWEWTIDGTRVPNFDARRLWLALDRDQPRIIGVRVTAPWGETAEHRWRVAVSPGEHVPLIAWEAEVRNWLESMCQAHERRDLAALVVLGEIHAAETPAFRRVLDEQGDLRVRCHMTQFTAHPGGVEIVFARTTQWHDRNGLPRHSTERNLERALAPVAPRLWTRIPRQVDDTA